MPYAGRPMGLLQSRADFVACALDQLVLAARGVAGWPLEGDSQKSDGGGAGSGNCQLRQCYALAYLAAALLPLPHAAVPAVTKAIAPTPDIRLLFLSPPRGPPPSQPQALSEAATG